MFDDNNHHHTQPISFNNQTEERLLRQHDSAYETQRVIHAAYVNEYEHKLDRLLPTHTRSAL